MDQWVDLYLGDKVSGSIRLEFKIKCRPILVIQEIEALHLPLEFEPNIECSLVILDEKDKSKKTKKAQNKVVTDNVSLFFFFLTFDCKINV